MGTAGGGAYKGEPHWVFMRAMRCIVLAKPKSTSCGRTESGHVTAGAGRVT
jgi:hypothetical protein